MPDPILQSQIRKAREKIECIEGAPRRFARMVPICGVVNDFLPNKGLPLGCVHAIEGETLATAIAFAALLSARISQTANGAILYAAPDRSLYPLGLLPLGVKLEQWIHVSVRRSNDLPWTILEALRCPQVSAVIGVVKAADLTFCRRLQLAAETSGATGFLLGHAASAVTRWGVSRLKAPPQAGFDEAFWELELRYSRGGRPGKWKVASQMGALTLHESPWETTLAG